MKLTTFLMMSPERKMRLTELQVRLIECNLSHSQIVERVKEANWRIIREEVQNQIRIYYLKDNNLCSCGQPATHSHGEEPCCGGLECCTNDDPSYQDLLTAQYVLSIKEVLQKRKQTSKPMQVHYCCK